MSARLIRLIRLIYAYVRARKTGKCFRRTKCEKARLKNALLKG